MIKVGTLAKLRRLYFRDKRSIKEICRQTGMSRNTVKLWLRNPGAGWQSFWPGATVSLLPSLRHQHRLFAVQLGHHGFEVGYFGQVKPGDVGLARV